MSLVLSPMFISDTRLASDIRTPARPSVTTRTSASAADEMSNVRLAFRLCVSINLITVYIPIYAHIATKSRGGS